MIWVLIETLWNVKIIPPEPVIRAISVLIETLWNVKTAIAAAIAIANIRINRNIMECKVWSV